MDIIDIILDKFSKTMIKRNKGVGVTPNTSISSRTDNILSFIKLKGIYESNLVSNLRKFVSGKYNKDTFLKKQNDLIRDTFRLAFLYGKNYTQSDVDKLSSDEVNSIGYMVGKEMAFMKKFADDIENKKGKMDYEKRIRMYSASLDPLFISGHLNYLPEDVKIEWMLGATDKHCIDCLSYAANSPYSKKTLPTVPKAGDSLCLSNCRCSLQYRDIGSENEYLYFILENYAEGKNIPEPGIVTELKRLKKLFYYNYGMGYITGETDYLKIADVIKKEYKDLIEQGEFALKNNIPVKSYVSEISLFKNNKNALFVDDISSIEIGDIISVHSAGVQTYVKVFGVESNGFYATDIGGNSRFYLAGDEIFFKMVA